MHKLYTFLKYTFITLWTVFIVAPFLWAISTSFKDFQSVNGGVTYSRIAAYENVNPLIKGNLFVAVKNILTSLSMRVPSDSHSAVLLLPLQQKSVW